MPNLIFPRGVFRWKLDDRTRSGYWINLYVTRSNITVMIDNSINIQRRIPYCPISKIGPPCSFSSRKRVAPRASLQKKTNTRYIPDEELTTKESTETTSIRKEQREEGGARRPNCKAIIARIKGNKRERERVTKRERERNERSGVGEKWCPRMEKTLLCLSPNIFTRNINYHRRTTYVYVLLTYTQPPWCTHTHTVVQIETSMNGRY